ncbi:MAG TPA: sigma-70 family RNA polymerase sigma factor [Candidatus Eisenbacteria bacterium]|nr:sigma-70 family RNA polymerase sigma factor [Candidatus Eisenbacteria bacterium]
MCADERDHRTQIRAPAVSPEGGAAPPLDLEGVRQRDPRALAALFDRYFDRLYAVVYRIVMNRTEAEDAIQEVFLKVHRGAASLDPSRDPLPWLVTIAANVARDRWRSGSSRLDRASTSFDSNPALRETLGGPDADGSNPERDLLARERAARVREALGKLKPESREVIVLREYEDLGYDRIAEILGVSEAAARKRFSRALDELGRHVNEAEL